MASQITYCPSTNSVPHPLSEHDATDSGYGTSTVGGSSIDSENVFERSFPSKVQYRHQGATGRQQEIYQENCRLLVGSIEDTKHILKVNFPCFEPSYEY
jgi:hypothetical protein